MHEIYSLSVKRFVRGSAYSNLPGENISHACRHKHTEDHWKVESVNDSRCFRGRAFAILCYVSVHTLSMQVSH